MTRTLFRLARTTAPAVSALVVQPNLSELLFVLSTLSSIGFDVTVALSFQDAKRSLSASRPSLLLTDVRLHEYNGLHLIHRMQTLWKFVPAILTSVSNDVVLRDEAERLGATFVVLPITAGALMAAVYRTALGGGREAIRRPYDRRQAERRQLSSPFSETDRRQRDRRRGPGELLQVMASLS
jgi:DNA-binding NtrC family response regulator